MTNPDSVLLNSKGLYSQSYNFSVVMYECENWTIKKAEWWRNDAFVLWCWKRLLIVPWTVRGSNQSILEEINPGYSLESLMLKLKLQYFGHLMQRADSLKRPWCWERLKAREEDSREWDGWMASPTQWTWVWANSRRYWRTRKLEVLQSLGSQRLGHDLAAEKQQQMSTMLNTLSGKSQKMETLRKNKKEMLEKRF